MHRTKPTSSGTLRAIAPWIVATMACLLAVIILSRFIDTLHLSIRRGQDLRAMLAATEATQSLAVIRLADASVRQQTAIR